MWRDILDFTFYGFVIYMYYRDGRNFEAFKKFVEDQMIESNQRLEIAIEKLESSKDSAA